ncbi:MAG: S8 family peptidase, partial [Pseudomonadota bacterium]
MKRQLYLQSVAAAALLAGAYPAAAQTGGDLLSISGDIQPFRGDIDPFRGDIDPFSGDISPFRGDINPFSGDISPFRGDIDPFYGDISPFWGDISPFWGDISPFSGDISPFWGDIQPFQGDISPFAGGLEGIGAYWNQAGPLWGDINDAWSSLGAYDATTQAAYNQVASDFTALVDLSRTQWGSAVATETNSTFDAAFADPILAKYGIDLNDASTFENIDAATRSQFFLEWYDGLMAFSGTDQVDHWMATINWTPTLTQDQGEGHDAVVGLLDVRISQTDDNIQYLTNIGGYNVSPNEHGAAVASLIAGRHDGQGVMGIAPRAMVKAYSPFDSSGSSNFQDIENGVNALTAAGANVINMSLGVPGYTLHQEVANIFRSAAVQAHNNDTVFVVASGNEGQVQTTNIAWDANAEFDNLLFVGSVDPNKTISFFSNSPGEACLTVGGVCDEANKLKNRFLVAPGELILVSDNNGGTTRLSGTSFAAPLVTGAISLIHDRWPWLQQHAKETADIILQTAEDLGEEGVDAVYGHGLLDVEAAQSPLNFDNLTILQATPTGTVSLSPTTLRNMVLTPGQLGLWEQQGASIYVTEQVGDTFRDFEVPLSTVLHGQTGSLNGNQEQYQRHVYDRLVDWAQGANFAAPEPVEGRVAKIGEWGVSMLASPVSPLAQGSNQDRPFNTSFLFQTENRKMTFQFGEGSGAVALTHEDGFNHYSDHDPSTGGVNPFLGLASGGMFAKVASELKPGLKFAFGFTQVTDDNTIVEETTGARIAEVEGVSNYQASAVVLDMQYAAAKNVRFNVGFTHLDEQTGVLGAQGSDLFSLDNGA